MYGSTRLWIGYLGMLLAGLVFLFAIGNAGNSDSLGVIFWSCCLFFILMSIAQSGHTAAKQWRNRTVIYQPAPQQQMMQQQSIIIQQQAPVQQAPVQQVAQPIQEPTRSPDWWVNRAQKLEIARDWEGAAQAYQMAGLYEEAGRIREAYLEEKDGVVLNIDRVGDTILQDSVMVQDGDNTETNGDKKSRFD
jgi:hypothetical protein